MEQIMKKIIPLIIAMFFFTSFSLAPAETKTFIKEYTYQASEVDSKVSCRAIALEQVKRLLLEELGTYLESHTEVINYQLTKDQITALAAGIVKTKIIKEKWDGKKYWLKVKIDADPREVAKSIDNLRQDKQKTRDLEESRKKINALLGDLEGLRKELKTAKSDKIKVKQYNDAIEELSASGSFVNGLMLHYSGDYIGAIDAYSKAIEMDPKYEIAIEWRGLAYFFNQSNSQKALADFDKLIEINPNKAFYYSMRGSMYLDIGDYKRAIRDQNSAIKLNPQDAISFHSRGIAYYKLGNDEEALNDYNHAIKLNPKFARAYRSRGIYYEKLKKNDQALDDYNKAIELDPKFVEAYISRGSYYYELNNYERAISDFSKIIELNQKFVLAYEVRGLAYSDLGKYEQATIDLSMAIDLGTKRATTYGNRGIAYGELGNFRQGILDLEKAIELDPNYGKFYWGRGNIYSKLGNHNQAINDYTKAIELNPTGIQWAYFAYNNRGNSYTALKDYGKAISDFTHAIQIAQNVESSLSISSSPYLNRGGAYYSIGNYHQAIKDYNKAIELNPQDFMIYTNRGQAHYSLGNDDQAIRDYRVGARLGDKIAQEFLRSKRIDW